MMMNLNQARNAMGSYQERRLIRFHRIIAFLGIILVSYIQAEAAQFEGSNIELPEQPTSIPEMEANGSVSTQPDAIKLDQAPIESLAALNVEVANDVYSEKDRHVLYCPKGNYMVVRNRIYLAGVDIDKVKQVKYLLHPSFSNPVAVSEDATNDFEVWIWSWGGFPITATITTQSGQVFEKIFEFSFKTKFDEAQSKGIPQAVRCEK